MSGRIVGEVLDNAPEDLTLSEHLVFITLAEDARERDRTATHCDLDTLIKRTRLKPGTIRNAVSTLIHRGLIKPLHPRIGKGTGRHQHYILTELHEGHRDARIRP